jgi:hypothetical protein
LIAGDNVSLIAGTACSFAVLRVFFLILVLVDSLGAIAASAIEAGYMLSRRETTNGSTAEAVFTNAIEYPWILSGLSSNMDVSGRYRIVACRA